MAFDLASATPVENTPPSGTTGFDLSTAQPVANPNRERLYDSRPIPRANQPGPDLLHEAVRVGGEGGRAILEGIAGLPLMAADAAAGLTNAALPDGHGLDSYRDLFHRGLVELGGPLPGGEQQSNQEKLFSAAVRGATGAAAGPALGAQLATAASPFTRGVGELLQSAPEVQAAAGAGGATASEVTRQHGGGETAQLAAGVLGSLAGGGPAALLRGAETAPAIEASLPLRPNPVPPAAATTAPAAQALRAAPAPEITAAEGAKAIGLDFGALDKGLQDRLTGMVVRAQQSGTDLPPDALARAAVYESLGIQPTKALVTRNFADALNEQNLLSEPEGAALRNIYATNNQAVRTRIAALNPDSAQALDNPTFGQQFRAPLNEGERLAQDQSNAMYKLAETHEGQNQTTVQPIVDYLQQNLPVLNATQAGKPVIAYLQKMGIIDPKNVDSIATPNATQPTGSGYQALPVNMKELSGLRQIVNDAWLGAQQNEPVAAAQLNQMRSLINEAEAQGGGDLYAAYRAARTQQGKDWDNNPLLDKLLTDKTGYRGTPAIEDSKVFDAAVLKSSPEQFAKVWKQLPPAARDLTQAQLAKHIEDQTFSNMGTNERGDIVASAAKLSRVLDTLGSAKLRTVFGEQKSADLDRLRTAVREISNPPRGTVPTGSAPKLTFLTRNILNLLGHVSGVPGAGALARGATSMLEKGAQTSARQEAATTAQNYLQSQPAATVDRNNLLLPLLSGGAGGQNSSQ